MTESLAASSQSPAASGQHDLQPHTALPRTDDFVVAGGRAEPDFSRQHLSLKAVLRHVLLMENASLTPDALLLSGAVDESALRRVNQVLNETLGICLQLDGARQQLQSAMLVQRDLETVLEMLAARIESGRASPAERRTAAARLTMAREMVTLAVGEWNRVGRRFTQITRLLPVQLEAGLEMLEPVWGAEMDRLAQACLSLRASVHVSLGQRAKAWSRRRSDPSHQGGVGHEDFDAWLSNLEKTRAQAVADFASAREVYLQSVLDFDREHAGLVRARSIRRTAEAGFRVNARRATDFADAILEEGRKNRAVILLRSQRQVAGYGLYALAGLLPNRFGLIEPAAGC